VSRLKKIEQLRGSLPIYVNFIDAYGQEKKQFPLSSLWYALLHQLSKLQYFLTRDSKSSTAPFATYIIPDAEILPLIDQLQKHAKVCTDKQQKIIISRCIIELIFLARGYMQIKESVYLLLNGEKVDFTDEELQAWTYITTAIRLGIEADMNEHATSDDKKEVVV